MLVLAGIANVAAVQQFTTLSTMYAHGHDVALLLVNAMLLSGLQLVLVALPCSAQLLLLVVLLMLLLRL